VSGSRRPLARGARPIVAVAVALLVAFACTRVPVSSPSDPLPLPLPDRDAGVATSADAWMPADASMSTPAVAMLGADAGPDAGVVRPPPPRWLKGSTHVHAAPSGDSGTDVPSVIAWYEAHGYDFIVLTDHNRVTRIDGAPRAG
jgi:hypothetical protein